MAKEIHKEPLIIGNSFFPFGGSTFEFEQFIDLIQTN